MACSTAAETCAAMDALSAEKSSPGTAAAGGDGRSAADDDPWSADPACVTTSLIVSLIDCVCPRVALVVRERERLAFCDGICNPVDRAKMYWCTRKWFVRVFIGMRCVWRLRTEWRVAGRDPACRERGNKGEGSGKAGSREKRRHVEIV